MLSLRYFMIEQIFVFNRTHRFFRDSTRDFLCRMINSVDRFEQFKNKFVGNWIPNVMKIELVCLKYMESLKKNILCGYYDPNELSYASLFFERLQRQII